MFWKFSLTHSYKAMWLYISFTSLPSMEGSQVRLGTTNLLYIITVKSEKNLGEYSNIFKLHCFILTNSKLRLCALWSIPLLRSHKMTKIWTPLLHCLHLFNFGDHLLRTFKTLHQPPAPPPFPTTTTTTHSLSKQ